MQNEKKLREKEMSNKEEYEKILKIVDTNQFSGEKEFTDKCATKFKNIRNAFYVAVFGATFFIMLMKSIKRENELVTMLVCLVTMGIAYAYLKQRKILHTELNKYLFRECYPDKGLSRYMNFIPMMLKKQMLWSKVHYNMGIGLYYLGDITRASQMLSLMQDSCKTANDMILALHLKQLVALYYMDMVEVIGCANDAQILFPKASKVSYVQKTYSDIQTYGNYANYYINHDLANIYQLFGNVYERPLDEVKRHFYLYQAAKECSDFQHMNTFVEFISANSGTTWYGKAIMDGFVPVARPDNYPVYIANKDRLNNPSLVDNSRKKYMIWGVVVLMLMYLATIALRSLVK